MNFVDRKESMLWGIPDKAQAQAMLAEAERLNPGPWIQHSLYVAQAAAAIAERCGGLNQETAYILGLLHDIGRRVGVTDMRHSLDGYKYALERGYGAVAKICITHSFPTQNIDEAQGEWDCSNEEYSLVKNTLDAANYDDYDRLVQLCDALALPSGFTLVEKRLIDVALRRGVNEHTIPKWRGIFQLKRNFEERMGTSIYDILPGVVENTFRK